MTLATGTDRPKRFTVKADGETIGKAELRRVPVAAIRVDSVYQRDASAQWVAEHAPFDEQRAGALVLSSRAGGPYCIDGGHRLALARESSVAMVNAFVIEGLTQKDEARLFTRYQRERRNLTSYALFRADLVARDPDTVAMVKVVTASGFEIGNRRSPKTITAIDAVRYVFRYGGAPLLTSVLRLLRTIWIGEEKALSGTIIRGLGLFLANATEWPEYEQERVEAILQHNAPMKVLRRSQAIAERRKAVVSGSSNVAEAFVELYNHGLPKGAEPLPALRISGKRRPAAVAP